MSERFSFTDEQWRTYQAIPEHGYSHRHWLEYTFNQWLPEHDAAIERASSAKAIRKVAEEINPFRPLAWESDEAWSSYYEKEAMYRQLILMAKTIEDGICDGS